MGMYNQILFAADLGKDSFRAGQRAMELAASFGAKLTLLHVVEPIQAYAFGYISTADIEAQLFEEAKKHIANLGDQLKVPQTQQLVEVGAIKSCVLDVAERIHADLIILGSHSKNEFLHLLGSTANAIVHSAKCDVFIVRTV